jgi:carboxyl-terminal processing protease
MSRAKKQTKHGEHEVEEPRRPLWQRFGKSIFSIAILLAVFGVGLGLGNGTISFQSGGQNEGLPNQLNYASVTALYNKLRTTYDGELSEQALIDGMRSGLVEAAGDPHTQFFTAAEAEEFNSDLSGSFSGIGAELSMEEDMITVVAPIGGFPAEKAGLKAKDIIVTVNDESTSGMSLDKAVSKIRGPVGSEVKLEIVRGTEQLTLKITRANINTPSVKHEIKDGVGYLTVTRFWTDTGDLMDKAAREFTAAGVTGVIVDLRGNPGGTLDSSVDAASLWLAKDATVLEEKRGGKVVKTYKASGNNPLKGVKTTVLINGSSASASEILAGALADNKAATLVGEKSYGKGSVQQILPLSDGSQVKITFARWYTPAGKNIDKEGIEPSEKVELTEEDVAASRDPQLARALELLK